MAPTSHSHRYPNQGMETNFADSVRWMQQNSSQITDTSTYWHLRFTWIQLVPKTRFQLPCHIIKYNTPIKPGFPSHLCQNLFIFRTPALFWSNRRQGTENSRAKPLLVVYIKRLGTQPPPYFCWIVQLFEFVGSFSWLKSVWQKHCNCHRPNTSWDWCDCSGNLGGFLVTDISNEPITPRAFRVLQHSKSLVSKSPRKLHEATKRGRKRDSATLICRT